MSNYRRANTKGGTYFFTVVTYRRQRFLCDDHVRQALRKGIRDYNPVKHSLVKCVKDWPDSTFHTCVKNGIYPEDWGGTEETMADADFGE